MGSERLQRGINDLGTVRPEIAAEWDPEKNGTLRACDVTAGSTKTVWWRCREGHSWRTAVYSRGSAGRGCPYCAGQKVLAGYNDLATKNPALAAEWDPGKNMPDSPETVTAGCSRRFYWLCPRGHSWKDSVNHRNRGRGCPYCAGQKLLKGYNDLGTTHPALAEEWDPDKNGGLTPSDVMAGSGMKAWWRCSLGHSWQAVVYGRKNGNGCPYCSGNRILPGFNDLKTLFPEIAVEWDYEENRGIVPETAGSSSQRKFSWKCSRGHKWKASTGERSRGQGCPYCSGRRVITGETDLCHLYPALMEEWDWDKNGAVDPGLVAPESHRKVWWIGKCGHSWQAGVANRVRGTGCPYCSGRKVLAGYNDLASLYPLVAAEWCHEKNGDLSPEKVHCGSGRYAWFRCGKGHEWRAQIVTRTRSQAGCPYCGNRIPVVGENDFATLYPELLEEWDKEKNPGISPSQFTVGSQKKIHWKCGNGHTWVTSIYHRAQGMGCPYCSYKKNKHKVVSGINDLAAHSPELAAEWDYQLNGTLRPEDVMPNSNRGVWWKCENGHKWRSSPNNRLRGSGCPYCDGKTPKRMRLV